MRGEVFSDSDLAKPKRISIHSPHAGRGEQQQIRTWIQRLFQSTRPMRGEVADWAVWRKRAGNFNPLAPCGARLHAAAALVGS